MRQVGVYMNDIKAGVLTDKDLYMNIADILAALISRDLD